MDEGEGLSLFQYDPANGYHDDLQDDLQHATDSALLGRMGFPEQETTGISSLYGVVYGDKVNIIAGGVLSNKTTLYSVMQSVLEILMESIWDGTASEGTGRVIDIFVDSTWTMPFGVAERFCDVEDTTRYNGLVFAQREGGVLCYVNLIDGPRDNHAYDAMYTLAVNALVSFESTDCRGLLDEWKHRMYLISTRQSDCSLLCGLEFPKADTASAKRLYERLYGEQGNLIACGMLGEHISLNQVMKVVLEALSVCRWGGTGSEGSARVLDIYCKGLSPFAVAERFCRSEDTTRPSGLVFAERGGGGTCFVNLIAGAGESSIYDGMFFLASNASQSFEETNCMSLLQEWVSSHILIASRQPTVVSTPRARLPRDFMENVRTTVDYINELIVMLNAMKQSHEDTA